MSNNPGSKRQGNKKTHLSKRQSQFTEGVQLPGQVNGNLHAVEPSLHNIQPLENQLAETKPDQQANTHSNQTETAAVMHQLSVMSLGGKDLQAPMLSESLESSKKSVLFAPVLQPVVTVEKDEVYQYPEAVIMIGVAVVSSFAFLIFGCWWSLWCTYAAIILGASSNTASGSGNYGLATQKLSTAICCISAAWIAMIFGATFVLGLTFGILYGY